MSVPTCMRRLGVVLVPLIFQISQIAAQSNPAPLQHLLPQALFAWDEIQAHSKFWQEVILACRHPHPESAQRIATAESEFFLGLVTAQSRLAGRQLAIRLVGEPGLHDPPNPSEFSSTINHPHFPLPPLRTLVYEKAVSGETERLESTVLPGDRVIDGISCRPVRTLQFVNGQLTEENHDYFAQRQDGTVMHFGEIASKLEDGFPVSLAGSWRSGWRGGIYGTSIPGTPSPGQVCRGGFSPDETEDILRVVAVNQTYVTSSGTYSNCVVIEEWSPLEPDEREHNVYAPGVGLILEINLTTGERRELVQIIN